MVDLMIEGDIAPGLLRARGIEVNTVVGRRMTARCPLGLLPAFLAMPGIDRVEVSERCEPTLDSMAVETGIATVRTVTPPTITGQTGAGVLIGIVDTGVDLTHPDFKNEDGTTRLVSVWDQTVAGTPPAGFTYGTEWSHAQIQSGVATEVDDEGHGTHVLGIIGGDGSTTGNGQPAFRYVGVAPAADLCVVKTDFGTTDIVDGVAYIFQVAAARGQKAVVNMSLSSQAGPHDGTYAFDTMVNDLTGPGKIVVTSAGNQQTAAIHAQAAVGGSPVTLSMVVPSYTRNSGPANDYLLFTGWYEGADQMSITVISPNGNTVGPVTPGTDHSDNNTPDGNITVFNGTTTPSNGDHEIYVQLYDSQANRAPATGTWQFVLTPISIQSTGRFDMWLYSNTLGPGASSPQWVNGLAPNTVVGTPASADSVIGVAAHVTKNCWVGSDGIGYCWNPTPAIGSIAYFSSTGPRRDGVIKPDISAPGFGVTSALSAATTPTPDPALVMLDGKHLIEAGTSMSSPIVAGTVGLLLAQPDWANASPSAIKARLKATARADAFTGSVPNSVWGAGKLNAAAALAPLFALHIQHPAKGQYIPPGKPDSVQVVVGGATAESVAFALSLDGGGTYPIPLGTLTAVVPGPPRSLAWWVDGSYATSAAKIRGIAYRAGSNLTAYSDSLFLIAAPTAVEIADATPAARFSLSPNVPNPFNPETMIRFATANAGRVTLIVYDIHGARVRALVNEWMPAGSFRARWDGRNDHGTAVASGVYLYELREGGNRISRKMSLLK
ncbi:MAG TPA: S8 family serine peptidase [Candidatus Eisenbacteria bacterium]|nr:S8 family serine peptidase [Candidatus Eisenbacteria bacterium]